MAQFSFFKHTVDDKIVCHPQRRGYYRYMKTYKSKVLAMFLLVAMCGQVVAYPLLLCPDMEPSFATANPAHPLSMDHHAGHIADNTSQSEEVKNHICKLCVSCSSVSVSEYGAANNQLAANITVTGYTNPLPNSSLENPFRPPIAA
tara:strand:+ start:869 stop:1306 length:438 start_codon:yes stop_codon:yes gene_type:complete